MTDGELVATCVEVSLSVIVRLPVPVRVGLPVPDLDTLLVPDSEMFCALTLTLESNIIAMIIHWRSPKPAIYGSEYAQFITEMIYICKCRLSNCDYRIAVNACGSCAAFPRIS